MSNSSLNPWDLVTGKWQAIEQDRKESGVESKHRFKVQVGHLLSIGDGEEP